MRATCTTTTITTTSEQKTKSEMKKDFAKKGR
jgi:hypothetical protein